MDSTHAHVKRFLYGHYFSNGLRQSIGVILPPLILIGIYDQPVIGMVAAFGALCVSIIDQPGPHQHRLNSMLGCAVLGTLTALVTGIATASSVALLFTVMALTFLFGLFSAFGRKGGLVGFAALLLMTLTMHLHVTLEEAAWHALATLGGALWYTAFSTLVTRYIGLWQERQALATSLFATAEYVGAKAAFYDTSQDLQACYRTLVPTQSALAEKQQTARDVILTLLRRGRGRPLSRDRILLNNIFIDMVDLQETMLATYTDYDILRRTLAGSDLLLFARDALVKLAVEIERVGMAVAGRGGIPRSALIKAELRALEYEVVLLKKRDFPQQEPEAWVVIVQVLRRLRNAGRLVTRMQRHATLPASAATPDLHVRNDEALKQFVSRENISLKRLTTNLTLDSPHMRYALRLSLAVGAGLLAGWALALSAQHLNLHFGVHGYWIVLTILVIMKPGFALSRQRNRWRVAGTLIGCALTVGLMSLTQEPVALLLAMLVASILSNGLVQLNYLASSVFNTMLVLLAFHFLAPGSLMVIGERAIDALIGSALVVVCTYILPYWENRSILPLARAAIAANRRLLALARQPEKPDTGTRPAVPEPRHDFAWRLARRNVHAAFGNFADAYYRMMLEPRSKRIATVYLNDLLVQNHMLAAQISSLSTLMVVVGGPDEQPDELKQTFAALDNELLQAEKQLLQPAAGPAPAAEPPAMPPPDTSALPEIAQALEPLAMAVQDQSHTDDPGAPAFETAHLTYQLRQMIRSVQRIGEDAYAVRAGPDGAPELSAKRAEPLIVPQHG